MRLWVVCFHCKRSYGTTDVAGAIRWQDEPHCPDGDREGRAIRLERAA